MPDDPTTRLLVREAGRFVPTSQPAFESLLTRHGRETRVRRSGAALLAAAAVVGVVLAAGLITEEPKAQPRPVVVAGPSPGTFGPADPLDPSRWPLPVSDAPCPDGPTGSVDYFDFVYVGELFYGGASASDRGVAALGRTILTTRCQLSRGAPNKGYKTLSGDASFLPPGTDVRELVGYDPHFRVGALVAGELRVFQSRPPDRRGTAADVFPGIAELVTAVHLTSDRNGDVLVRISDPDRVRRLVQLLLASPYSPKAGFGGSDTSLVLRLDDGSIVGSAYISAKGQLLDGVQTPPEFRDELLQALRTSEGQPLPRCVRVPGNFAGPRHAEAFVGLTEAVARDRATAAGDDLRVVGRDGSCTGERTPNSNDRVNVDVRDGVVRDAARY